MWWVAACTRRLWFVGWTAVHVIDAPAASNGAVGSAARPDGTVVECETVTKHTTCFDVGGLEFEIYAGAQVHTLRAGNASEKAMYVVVRRWPETRRPHNRALWHRWIQTINEADRVTSGNSLMECAEQHVCLAWCG